MINENYKVIKNELIDMIKYLNSSDLKMNDRVLYYNLGEKVSTLIDLININNFNNDGFSALNSEQEVDIQEIVDCYH